MSWLGFSTVFVMFFVTHSVPLRPIVKAKLVSVLGPTGFTVGYSFLSSAALAWLIYAAGNAPYVELWAQAPWQKHVVLAGMAVVCLLVALAAGRPNPFSFGGINNERFEASRPGVVRWTRHPFLLAMALWAGLHSLPNGDLAHAILFGAFAGFSLLGMRLIDRRKRRLMGEAHWTALRDDVAQVPLFSAPGSWVGLGLRIFAGAAGFLLLLMLHPIVLGVSPLPAAML